MKRIGVGTWECSDLERKYVNDVLDSGRLSYGPYSKKLESQFASIHGCEYGVLSNSGTSSLQAALQALKELHGWKDWDEVIIPAVTFVATANIVLHNKMTPILVDIDPLTYNMDMEQLYKVIGKRTRVIIPVHLFGNPAQMGWFKMMLPKRILVIEDACEAAFASINGIPVGSWGDIGCFSTYMAHLLTTGVGGIATTSNPDYAAKMRSLVNHGRDGIYVDIDTEASKEVVERRFKFESIGHSFRVTELESAIGLAQLGGWEEMIERRSTNANVLIAGLRGLSDDGRIQLHSIPHGHQHSWMMFPVVMNREDKWGITQHLEERGIETREMLPLINQPCYNNMWDEDDYPVAQWINDSGFYIGCHQGLSGGDIGRILEAFQTYEYK